MLYRWHTVQPEREIRPAPEPRVVYEDDEVLWINADYRPMLTNFINHLKSQRFRPDYTARELQQRYRDTYGEEPSDNDGLVALFVKTGTWRELFGCSYGFDGWQPRAATDNSALVDCKGRPFEVFDNMYRGDYGVGVGGRDPANNWGLIQQTSKRDSSIVVREVWACCGLPRDHPGCWIHTEKYKIEPYRAINSFALWRYVIENDWNSITNNLWNYPTTKGTMWKDESKYNALHKEIQTIKSNQRLIDEYITVLRESYEEKANEDDPVNVPLDPFGKLSPVAKQQLEKLCALQNEYNAIQCGARTMTPNDIFALDDGVVRMNDPDNLNTKNGVRFLGKKNTVEEYLEDAARFGEDAPNGNIVFDVDIWDEYYDGLQPVSGMLGNWDEELETKSLEIYAKLTNKDDFLNSKLRTKLAVQKNTIQRIKDGRKDLLRVCELFAKEFSRVTKNNLNEYDRLEKIIEELKEIEYDIAEALKMPVQELENFYANVTKLKEIKDRTDWGKMADTELDKTKPKLSGELLSLDDVLAQELLDYKKKRAEIKLELELIRLLKMEAFDMSLSQKKRKEMDDEIKRLNATIKDSSIARAQRKKDIKDTNYNTDNWIFQEEFYRPLTENAKFIETQWKRIKVYKNEGFKDYPNREKWLLSWLIYSHKLSQDGEAEIVKVVDSYENDFYFDKQLKENKIVVQYEKLAKETGIEEAKLKEMEQDPTYAELILRLQAFSDRDNVKYTKEIQYITTKLKNWSDKGRAERIRQQAEAIYNDRNAYKKFVDALPKEVEKKLFLVRHKKGKNYSQILKNAQIEFIFSYLYDGKDKYTQEVLENLRNAHKLFTEFEPYGLSDWILKGVGACIANRTGDFDDFARESSIKLQQIRDVFESGIEDFEEDLIKYLIEKNFYFKYEKEKDGNIIESRNIVGQFSTENAFPEVIYLDQFDPHLEIGIFFQRLGPDCVGYLRVLLSYVHFAYGKITFEEFMVIFDDKENDLNEKFYDKNPLPKKIELTINKNKRIAVENRFGELPKNIKSLIVKNHKLYKDYSCWMDSSFTTMFSIPGNSLIKHIMNRDSIYSVAYKVEFKDSSVRVLGERSNRTAKCSDADIKTLHGVIVEDILDIQTPDREKRICQSRLFWTKQFGCVESGTTEDMDDPRTVLKNLVSLYNTNLEGIMDIQTQVDEANIAPTLKTTRIIIAQMEQKKPIKEMKKMKEDDDPQLIVNYKNWRTNSVYQLAGIIVFRAGHYTSYVYDFGTKTWTYIDIGKAPATTTWKTFIGDVENDIFVENFLPMYFVYYSDEEVDQIVGQTIVVPATIAPPPAQPPQELEEEFKKLRFALITTKEENKKLFEEFLKKTAPYTKLTEQVEHVQKINDELLESLENTSYGRAHARLQVLTDNLKKVDTNIKMGEFAERVKQLDGYFEYINKTSNGFQVWLRAEWKDAYDAFEQAMLNEQKKYQQLTSPQRRVAERREKQKEKQQPPPEPELKEDDINPIFRQFIKNPKFKEYYFNEALKEKESSYDRPLYIVVTYSNELKIDPEDAEDFRIIYGFDQPPPPEEKESSVVVVAPETNEPPPEALPEEEYSDEETRNLQLVDNLGPEEQNMVGDSLFAAVISGPFYKFMLEKKNRATYPDVYERALRGAIAVSEGDLKMDFEIYLNEHLKLKN